MNALTQFAKRPPAPNSLVGTAATGATKPRLVGTSTIDEVNQISPGMGNALKTEGLKGKSFVRLVRDNPGKAAAAGVAVGLGSTAGYEQLVELANSTVETVRAVATRALEQIDEIEGEAGLNDPTPGEDGQIAGYEASAIQTSYAVVAQARDHFKDAAAAAGGRSRLIALMKWFAVDPDLQQIVLDLED